MYNILYIKASTCHDKKKYLVVIFEISSLCYLKYYSELQSVQYYIAIITDKICDSSV